MENFNPPTETIEGNIEKYEQKLSEAYDAINELILARQNLVSERDADTDKYIIQIKDAFKKLFPQRVDANDAPNFNIDIEEETS
jgi:hypothetical protein